MKRVICPACETVIYKYQHSTVQSSLCSRCRRLDNIDPEISKKHGNDIHATRKQDTEKVGLFRRIFNKVIRPKQSSESEGWHPGVEGSFENKNLEEVEPHIQIISRLINDFGSIDEKVQGSAIRKLSKIGSPAIAPLIQCLGSEERGAHAVLVLEKIGLPAIAPLIQCLESKSDRSTNAILALSRIGSPAVPRLRKILLAKGEHWINALITLREIGSPEAIAAIEEIAVKDSDVKITGESEKLRRSEIVVKDTKTKHEGESKNKPTEWHPMAQTFMGAIRDGDRDAVQRSILRLDEREDKIEVLKKGFALSKKTKWHAITKDLQEAIEQFPPPYGPFEESKPEKVGLDVGTLKRYIHSTHLLNDLTYLNLGHNIKLGNGEFPDNTNSWGKTGAVIVPSKEITDFYGYHGADYRWHVLTSDDSSVIKEELLFIVLDFDLPRPDRVLSFFLVHEHDKNWARFLVKSNSLVILSGPSKSISNALIIPIENKFRSHVNLWLSKFG